VVGVVVVVARSGAPFPTGENGSPDDRGAGRMVETSGFEPPTSACKEWSGGSTSVQERTGRDDFTLTHSPILPECYRGGYRPIPA
jgi:hypothetical protein